MKNNFDKTVFLTRFGLRRDRWSLVAWILVLAGLMASVAYKFEGIYGTSSSIAAIENTLKSPAMIALFGKFNTPMKQSADVFGTEMLIFMALMMVIMNIYFAIRGSRNEEDSGLTELLASHSIGRMANILAVSLELLLINVVVGILFSIGIQFSGMQGIDTNGSWLLGMVLASVGLFFGMVGLLSAQIADNSRNATTISYGIFGLFYILRMYTDLKKPSATWLNPFGIIEKISAFHNNDWRPVWILGVVSLVVWALVLFANQHRDIGSGLIATRPGRANASSFLRGPITLVMQLHRTSIIVWIIGLFILGTTYGSIFNTIGNILKTNPTMQTVFGKAAVNAANHQILLNFVSVITIVCVGLAAIPAIQAMNSLKKDQTKGYLENIFAKQVSRVHVFGSYLITAIIAGELSFIASLMGLYLAGNAVLNHGKLGFQIYLNAFIAYSPTILTAVAISAFFVGMWPKGALASWIYVFYGIYSMYLGSLLKLPEWAKKFTAFGWANKVPVHQVDYGYFGVLILITVVLIAVGIWRYQRRDLS
ncbi:ABC transporter permease [Lentilactobacillus sp. SPB1-3]|uniref:ABC transporter permease n=1 Tax=Lentilactobacillus terminaliae TaxID=3003483 RepID=A0ACD5DI21_9LACO|nr:ABC transporter permease subunit [Lentilactobacillus sp. SPB1-3]MCZ0977057.1 ABC transporter permease subunit [Lentilactobacillus sp. SPB1-3]